MMVIHAPRLVVHENLLNSAVKYCTVRASEGRGENGDAKFDGAYVVGIDTYGSPDDDKKTNGYVDDSASPNSGTPINSTVMAFFNQYNK